jgi:photosystem II stability/assembly factor-like uncharacterized protein
MRCLLFCALLSLLPVHAGEPWRSLGPGGGGAMFLPTISPHDARTAYVACDMTGSYLTHDGGQSWRMIDLHGPGRFAVFDPLDPRTLYVATIGLYRSSDAGANWSLVYPPGASSMAILSDHADRSLRTAHGDAGTVDALAIDPADSRTLYAVVTSGARTLVRVSVDGGRRWNDSATLTSPALAIYVDARSPRADRTLYVAMRDTLAVRVHGAWRGVDVAPGGVLLSASGGFAGRDGSFRLYAITNEGAAVWSSATQHWQRMQPGWKARAVATSLNHAETAYLSYSFVETTWWRARRNHFGVAVSRDGGAHWAMPWEETTGAAPNVDIGGWISRTLGPEWPEHPSALGVSPVDPAHVYATDFGRALRSADGGQHWHAVYTRAASATSFTTTGLDVTTNYGVHTDPRNARHLWLTMTDIGLWQSYDAGASWSPAQRGVPAEWRNTAYWLVYDPAAPGRLWAAFSGTHDLPRPKMWRHTETSTYKGGVCRSDDNGATWKPLRDGLPESAVTHLLLDPRSPAQSRLIYAAAFGHGVYRSNDGGTSWQWASTGLPEDAAAWRLTLASDGTLYLVMARRSEDGSLGNADDGALYRSTDGAAHWQRMALPARVNGPMGLAVDARDAKLLHLAAWGRENRAPGAMADLDGGIYRSTDGGASWNRVLARDAHVYDVTADPAQPETLYAAGFESTLWRSTDRGQHWAPIAGPPFQWLHRVIPDPAHAGELYVTTFGGGLWHGPAGAAR